MEQTELKSLVQRFLSETREMVLATEKNNVPWAAALVFGHDANFNLYWVSYEDSRHSSNLQDNPKVAATITVQPTGEGKDKGLQIEGEARKLEKEEILGAAREYFAKRGTTKMPKTLDDVNDLAQGRSWYCLEPTKIYVLDQELFGYDRMEYSL